MVFLFWPFVARVFSIIGMQQYYAGALSRPKDRDFKGRGYIPKKGYEHKFYFKKSKLKSYNPYC